MAGVEVPLLPCEHFYLLTRPVPGAESHLPTLSDHDSYLYIRDESQGLLVGCFEPLGKPIDPERLGPDFAFQLLPEDWDHFEPMMLNALHRLPVLETAEVRMLLNGPESFTPDGSFMLGEAAETRGFFLGCGMNSVGVATGGGAGMALAHSIVHGRTPMDLHEADPQRFPSAFHSLEALMARAPEALGSHYEVTYPGRQFKTAREPTARCRCMPDGMPPKPDLGSSTPGKDHSTSTVVMSPHYHSAGRRGSTRWAVRSSKRISVSQFLINRHSAKLGSKARTQRSFSIESVPTI